MGVQLLSRYPAWTTQSMPSSLTARMAFMQLPVARRYRLFKAGHMVRVVDGPFAAFNGKIDRLDLNGLLKVLVDLFSRMTPVELDEGQIEAA
jgi:transcription antitermination factor NusG